MKRNALLILIIVAATLAGFYSCEKDKDGDKTTAELLTSKTWAYDTLEISDVNDVGLVLAAAFLHLGYSDAEYVFHSDGTYTLTTLVAGVINGTWELPDDNTLLMDKGTQDEMEFEILLLTSTKCNLDLYTEGNFLGTDYAGDVILKFSAR